MPRQPKCCCYIFHDAQWDMEEVDNKWFCFKDMQDDRVQQWRKLQFLHWTGSKPWEINLHMGDKTVPQVFCFTIRIYVGFVKFDRIGSHSPMRGHVGHPEASQGDLEIQPVLWGIDKSQGECTTCVSQTKSQDERDAIWSCESSQGKGRSFVSLRQKSRCKSNAKVRGNVQPLWA